MQKNLVFLTATNIESETILETSIENSFTPKPYNKDEISYHKIGIVQSIPILLVQTARKGSTGIGGSQQTTQKIIDLLNPMAIILCGIAYGMDSKDQKIGDVLISENICLHEVQKITTDEKGAKSIIPRGPAPEASPKLVSIFKTAKSYWNNDSVDIIFGQIISTEKLINNKSFLNEIRNFYPEAVGGEMEAAGLYSACSNKIDWIVAKSICDFADGNKDENKEKNQAIAAKNIAKFIFHTLSNINFLNNQDKKNKREYQEIDFRKSDRYKKTINTDKRNYSLITFLDSIKYKEYAPNLGESEDEKDLLINARIMHREIQNLIIKLEEPSIINIDFYKIASIPLSILLSHFINLLDWNLSEDWQKVIIFTNISNSQAFIIDRAIKSRPLLKKINPELQTCREEILLLYSEINKHSWELIGNLSISEQSIWNILQKLTRSNHNNTDIFNGFGIDSIDNDFNIFIKNRILWPISVKNKYRLITLSIILQYLHNPK